jgi:PAS domain S-box-containing protein
MARAGQRRGTSAGVNGPERARADSRRRALIELARSPALRGEDREQALRAVLASLCSGLGLAFVSYWTLDEQGVALHLEACHPAPGRAPARLIDAAATPGYFAALRASQVLTAFDARAAVHFAEFIAPPARGCIDLPCLVDGRLAGVLHGEAAGVCTWSEADRGFALGVTGLLELALAADRHRAAGRQARLAQQRYQQLLELFPDGVLLQAESGVQYINPAGLKLLGLERQDQLLGVDMKHYVLPGQQELLRARMRQMKAQGGALPPVVLKMRKADGTVRDVEVRSVRLAQGDSGLMQTIYRDVTRRLAFEASLRERESQYRSLFELSPFAVLIQDMDAVHQINPAGLRLLGATDASQIVGKPSRQFVSGAEVEIARRRFAALQAGEELPPYEFEFRRLDGATLPVLATSVAIEGRAGAEGQVLAQTILLDLSERRASEAALKAGEARYRKLVEMSPYAVLMQDLDGIRYVNPAGLRLLGASDPAQLVGRSIMDFVLPEYHEEVRARAGQLNETGAYSRPVEHEFRRLDGSIVPVEVTSATLASAGPTGQPMVQTIVRDLTERRVSEVALKAGEARYRNLFELSPYAVILQDIDAVRFINPAGLRLFGAREAGEIVGRSMLDLVPAHLREEILRRSRLPLPLGSALPATEQEICRMDGTIIPVEVISATIDEAGPGRPHKLVQTIMRDLSERRAVEAALRRFQQDLEEQVARRTEELAGANHELRTALSMQGAIFEATADAIMVVDREGRPVHYNQKLLDLWGITAQDLEGTDSASLLRMTRERTVRSLRGLFDDDAVLSGHSPTEDVLQLRNGRYIETSASPQILDGKVVGRVWSARDVTERVRAEQQARELNASLEERVRQRTGELAGANRELEAFGYSISHDLRAPVRAVSGFAGILKFEHGQALGAEGLALVERIQNAGERMNAMIEGLLSLARLGDRELRRVDVDLTALARGVWLEFESIEPGRGIEFILAPGLAAVGDSVLLSTLLQNLIGNARKYSRGQEHARIEVGWRDTARGRAFFVADNGAGFDMAHADKLFLLFSRLHGAGEFEGTGIGLATAQRIVHRHGGQIWAESAPGEGATFYFTLP